MVITHVTRTSPTPILYRKDPTRGVFGPLARAYADLTEGFSVEISVLSGAPAPELVHEAELRGAEAIVIGTRTRAEPGEDRLGTTAWGVVQSSRLPVLLLPPPDDVAGPHDEWPPLQFSRIVHSTDFSPMAHRSMRFARDLAAGADLPIMLVHVLQSRYREGHGGQDEDPASESLASLVKGLKSGGLKDVESHIAKGTVWKCILSAAEAVPGSLVVMGTRGRGFVSNLILGSQSREVVRHTRIPLFLIPPAWRAPTRDEDPFEEGGS